MSDNLNVGDIKGDGGPGGSGKGGAGGDGGRGGDVNIFNRLFKSPPSIFEVLEDHVVWDALYDSGQRCKEHAVTCQPETQTRVLDEIRSWADSTTTTPICWLSGPAGTGKTTVAHTIAEEYKDDRLAATFFFWRKTGDRDDIDKLVATLAWQIAKKISSAEERMEEAMELKNKARVPFRTLSFEHQLSKLLVHGPTANPNFSGPNLIIIDGLDECASRSGIRRLIDWLRMSNSPFRFLLTSRPEPQIEACFRPSDRRINTLSLLLTESKDSVRKYFDEELKKIKRERLSSKDSSDWLPRSSVDRLVEKSEGLFVYAATAVRYIGGEGHPENRLADVLKLHKGLDPLYAQVIEEAKKWDDCDIVLRSLMYLRYPLCIDDLSTILLAINNRLKSDVIRIALNGCHSIVIITGDNNTDITFHHASLRDFLTDQSRSNTLFYTPALSHGQLMVGCLDAITRSFSDGIDAPKYAFISWHYHASVFLSMLDTDDRLEELKEAEGLLQKIDLKWVKFWMVQALYWTGVPYLVGKLTQEKGLAKRDWTGVLKWKFKSISKILEKFMKYQEYYAYDYAAVRVVGARARVGRYAQIEMDVDKVCFFNSFMQFPVSSSLQFFTNKKISLLPNIITLEGSIILGFKHTWQ